MNDFNKSLFKKKLLEATKKMRNPAKIREFYWNCIQSHGYSVSNKKIESREENEVNDYINYNDLSEYQESDYYYCKQCNTELNPGDICGFCESSYFVNNTISYSESQQMTNSNLYTSNKTFIENISASSDRISNLNTWINSNSEDTAFMKTVGVIRELVHDLKIPNDEQVFKVAINTYYIIKNENTNFRKPSGSLLRGYIVLCVFYAIISSNNFKKITDIIPYLQSCTLADIPEALRNIKMIFNFNTISDNQKITISPELQNEFNELLSTLKNNGVFNFNNYAQKAAVKYYILKKNGKKVSYSELSNNETSVASIRTNVNIINNFIKSR